MDCSSSNPPQQFTKADLEWLDNYLLTPRKRSDKKTFDMTHDWLKDSPLVKRPKCQFSDTFDKCAKVLAERESTFNGSADGMFADIGELASLIMPKDPTYGQQAAATLLALKLIRMKANPTHEDSSVDACCYLLFYHKELCK